MGASMTARSSSNVTLRTVCLCCFFFHIFSSFSSIFLCVCVWCKIGSALFVAATPSAPTLATPQKIHYWNEQKIREKCVSLGKDHVKKKQMIWKRAIFIKTINMFSVFIYVMNGTTLHHGMNKQYMGIF